MAKIIWALAGVLLVGYGAYLWAKANSVTVKAYPFAVEGKVLSIAHRGGRGLWPENTMWAFERALNTGVDVLELDVRRTQDGKLVVIHDDTVDRTTNGNGPVKEYTLETLNTLDAGYRWTQDGQDFPFRGKGITVPTLEQVLVAFPQTLMVIEIKEEAPTAATALCDMLARYGKNGQVMVAGFSSEVVERFRAECSSTATSTTVSEVYWFLALHKLGLGAAFQPRAQALQVPEQAGPLQLVNAAWMASARGHGMAVHVWTVNETLDLQRLVALGVDGIITDYPDRLAAVLGRTPGKSTGKSTD
jgi:glycerophosphoryl diester phosphodiesterase